MKRLFILFIIILLPINLFSQLVGSGTWQIPYSGGTLYTDLTWNPATDTIYINGDITIGNSGHLTIKPGIFVKFLTAGCDIFITGSGTLTAKGDLTANVTFTADYDKDKIHGENYDSGGETWGHISFESSTGISEIDSCVIEYGRVSGSGTSGYGGGIHANTNNLTISYTTFRNNKADWGGGIFVNQNRNPSISYCYFYNNKSIHAGGGAYFWNGTSSVITNSIFDSNKCLEPTTSYYTGGGLASQAGNSLKIINCTFVNNTSTQTNGQSIMLYGSSSDLLQNCIVWGSTGNHLYLSGTYTIQYTAVQGTTAPTGTGNFTLNSSNTGLNPQGPYFKSMSGSDWSIEVVSPCRDAGTTPSSSIPQDYAGNSRVRTYDIGAFEVQYNYWLTSAGSTDWATGSNWNGGVPTNSQNVVITTGATNYPTGSTSLDYTIGSDYGLVLEPAAKATFNTLTKTGDLKLMSNSSGTSSLITNNSVSAIMELFLTGGGGSAYKWHYISSPISSLPVNTFILKSTMDFAQYFEARPSTNPLQGWIAYDGWIYYGGGYLTGIPYVISGTNMNVGQGYNYYYASDYKFSFSGSTNVSTVSPTISFGGDATLHGFNLLGNPFSAGLDWTTIINDAGFPSSTSKGLYFTRNNSQCSYIAGVGYPDASVTGIIPPMQGFFIHTTNTSTTLPLLSSARAHNIPARYKGGEEIIPLVRLQLDSDTLMDNTVVRFDSKASSVLDNDFDAVRMFLSESVQYIYSTDGPTKYAINGQPFPETSVQIPLSVNIVSPGNHTIAASQLQGLETYNIGLKDNTSGFTADLKLNPVVLFASEAGTYTDRFVLLISNITTGRSDLEYFNDDQFNIYQAFSFINILPVSENWDGKAGSLKIYNMTGQIIGSDNSAEFYKNSLIQILAPSTKGVYFVEFKSGMQRHTGKVVIR